MRLSTLTPLSSENCCRHFSRNVVIVSPFLHYVAGTGIPHACICVVRPATRTSDN